MLQNNKALLITQTLSNFSQWIDIFLIFSMPVFVWKLTPEHISYIALLFALPGIFISPLVGTMVDKKNPYKIMLIGLVSRILLTFAITINSSFNAFLIFIFLKGVANVLYWPAVTVVINQVIQETHRMSYFSSLSAWDKTTKILTPLIMLWITTVFSMKSGFVLSTLLLCTALYFIFKIQFNYDKDNKNNVSYIAKRYAGFAHFKDIPTALKYLICFALLLSFALAVYDPHLASFIKYLHYSEKTYSLLISATGLGAIAGAILVKTALKNSQATTLTQIGLILYFISVLSTTFSLYSIGHLPILLMTILWFISGLGYEFFYIGYAVFFQKTCPPEILARLYTTTRSLQLL